MIFQSISNRAFLSLATLSRFQVLMTLQEKRHKVKQASAVASGRVKSRQRLASSSLPKRSSMNNCRGNSVPLICQCRSGPARVAFDMLIPAVAWKCIIRSLTRLCRLPRRLPTTVGLLYTEEGRQTTGGGRDHVQVVMIICLRPALHLL